MLTSAQAQQLDASEFLRGTAPEAARIFQTLWKHKTLAAGQELMTAQQPGNALYFILDGTVKIHVQQADGGDVFIDIAAAGDIVGEMSIIDHATRSASATAMEETHVLSVSRAEIEEIMNRTPLLSQNIARIISNRLRYATERIQVMATLDTFGRVAHQLSFLEKKYGRPTPAGIKIPIRMTQGDLADLVGATRERVNQVIGTFKREQILSVDTANHITIHKPEALAKYTRRHA